MEAQRPGAQSSWIACGTPTARQLQSSRHLQRPQAPPAGGGRGGQHLSTANNQPNMAESSMGLAWSACSSHGSALLSRLTTNHPWHPTAQQSHSSQPSQYLPARVAGRQSSVCILSCEVSRLRTHVQSLSKRVLQSRAHLLQAAHSDYAI